MYMILLIVCKHIQVPVGTFFRDLSGNVIADLQHSSESFVAARGGAGGKGNYFFLTNENRAPTTYEEGGCGEAKVVYAELRAIADIGMVSELRLHSRSFVVNTLDPHYNAVIGRRTLYRIITRTALY